MARRKKGAQSKPLPKALLAGWSRLTWDDLDRWTDSRTVERGLAYQRQGRVTKLAIAEDGRLLATVTGTERYVTSAWLNPRARNGSKIDSVCSCPIGASGCKHGVAVVAELLELLADDRQPSLANDNDARWSHLTGDARDDDEFIDDEGDDGDDEPPSRPAKRRKRRSRAETDVAIKTHLEQKSHEDLAAWAWSLVERFPELRRELQERIDLGEGDADRLLSQARREMRRCTAERGWRNHWNGEGNTPDYSALKRRLERMTEIGHADAVLRLGRELITLGMEQVGESQDEGETAAALGDCLDAVFNAVLPSTLAAPEKLLYVIDAYLQEDYDLFGDAADAVIDAAWTPADWSAVADVLAGRLTCAPAAKDSDEFMTNYRRDQISNWLLQAMQSAGRQEELSPIYEREALATGSYQRLVSFLIEQKRYDEAERWAGEGIRKTWEKYPGIASGLATSLCDVARKRKQWKIVAAHAACKFFASPSAAGYQELVEAADKAKCGKAMRAQATRFLESGVSPLTWAEKEKAPTIDSDFPLSIPDYFATLLLWIRRTPSASRHDVLLEIAIADKRADDALKWYEKLGASRKRARQNGSSFDPYSHYSHMVAGAVASTHPHEALAIYQQQLDDLLPQAAQSAYDGCANYLGKMRAIMKSLDREDHWDELVADIRHNYRNRPRFMEALDKLESRTIVQSRRKAKRR